MNNVLDKWGSTGLLEGLSPLGSQRMAVLLENQKTSLEKCNSHLTKKGKTYQTEHIQEIVSVLFPLVRRVYGEWIELSWFRVVPEPFFLIDNFAYVVSITRKLPPIKQSPFEGFEGCVLYRDDEQMQWIENITNIIRTSLFQLFSEKIFYDKKIYVYVPFSFFSEIINPDTQEKFLGTAIRYGVK